MTLKNFTTRSKLLILSQYQATQKLFLIWICVSTTRMTDRTAFQATEGDCHSRGCKDSQVMKLNPISNITLFTEF